MTTSNGRAGTARRFTDLTFIGAAAEVDQLLSADRAHAAMTMHAENARKAAPNACRTQQPGAGVRAVADRPAQSTDHDAIPALAALVDHGWTGRRLSQAEYPPQRRACRVGADVGLS